MNYWDKLEPTDENISRLFSQDSSNEIVIELNYYGMILSLVFIVNRGLIWHQTKKRYGYNLQKGLKKIDIIDMADLTTNVMAPRGKYKSITLKILERICKVLNGIPDDVFSFDDEYVEEGE